MLQVVQFLLFILLASVRPLAGEVLVMVDGAQIEVESYVIKGGLVIITAADGKLLSLPISYVDFPATERANQADSASDVEADTTMESESDSQKGEPVDTAPISQSESPESSETAREGPPREPSENSIDQEPAEPTSPPPARSDSSGVSSTGTLRTPQRHGEPNPKTREASAETSLDTKESPARRTSSEATLGPRSDAPPPLPAPTRVAPGGNNLASDWQNSEHHVQLRMPSANWRIADATGTYGVDVYLENRQAGGEATLTTVPRQMPSHNEFLKAVRELHASGAFLPGFRSIRSGPVKIGPYTAHETQFIATLAGEEVFNWQVLYYSKDGFYVLSLSCPAEKQRGNAADFSTLLGNVVIDKARGDLTPRGSPRS